MGEKDAKATIEGAIEAALQYERRVMTVYVEAVSKARDAVGRKVFQVLADEEQGHVEYLEDRLRRSRAGGPLEPGGIETRIPSAAAIEAARAKLQGKLEGADHGAEVDLLRKALAVEEETSGFYRRMVEQLPAEGQAFFRPFLAIEEGHVAIVQAEIDAVTGMGFWFDMKEFDLEAG